MTVDKIIIEKMFVNKMIVDKITFDKMTVYKDKYLKLIKSYKRLNKSFLTVS